MAERRLVGVPGAGAWAYLARALLSRREIPGFATPAFSGKLVLVFRGQGELEDFADSYKALAPLFDVDTGPAAVFGEDARGHLASLELLKEGARLIAAVPDAFSAPLPSTGRFSELTLSIKVGQRLPRSEAIGRLSAAGYSRVDFVESPGEFAVRGAVLDFFAIEPAQAVRVLFDEDVATSMRVFEPGTQATTGFLGEARAVPASLEAAEGRLADWTGADALWVVDADYTPAEDAAVLRAAEGTPGPGELDFGARLSGVRPGAHAEAWAAMERRAAAGGKVFLFSLNRGEDHRVQELLEGRLSDGRCQFLIGPLQKGFEHPGLGIALFSTSEIFDRHYRPSARWKHFTAATRGGLRLRDLRQGDYVVHQDYGVSRYQGLKPVESPGHGALDCLLLEFRGSDRLYVPMTEFGRVQKYSAAEGKRPRLSSLDTRKWEEVKRLVKEGVRDLAEQLLKIHAERAARPGYAFPSESAMEREFAEAFPYEETPDQARAIAETLEDMMSPHPMDRLVIGDVGYGKTEVAMRAAFKCVAAYKQAMVLVPTTILADQHFRTFAARMADYPLRLGLLTRFQTPKEQKTVIAGLKEGRVDVVIGTARLLQKDVAFKDLGLVVIDEEHRFGVKDKEKVKSFRSTVDCLALSATPIPRSLNQALSGMRGISLIESAPTGRQPIVTKVGPWDENVAAQAIAEELGRGGQVYYVHNRVRSMEDCVATLRKILPTARFGKVHGQMKGPEIEKAMWEFFNKRFDVLVASTIIESGLDIPAVNTLLVEDAHEFGLAQLYQLRGRVGRERQRAYCYLFFPERHADFSSLSEDARKRLEALKEFGELGAGIKLAMRDLEIRGAGDLLGARQHGFINAVGVDFYTQMLNEEVSTRQGRAPLKVQADVAIDVRLPAYIPEPYLPNEMQRLEFYKRILRANASEADALKRELEDLCGPAPVPALNLFALLKARAEAARAGVKSIVQKDDRIELYFRADAPVDAKTLQKWTARYKDRLQFVRSEEGDGVSVALAGEKPLAWLDSFFSSTG